MKKYILLVAFVLFIDMYVFGQNISFNNYDNIGLEYRKEIKQNNVFSYDRINKYTNKDSVLELHLNKYTIGKHKNNNDISNYKNLISLTLANFNYDEIPNCVFDLKNLRELNLVDVTGNWNDLFMKISKLKQLKTLTISRGNMKYMPQTIELISHIERLEINDVPIIDFNDNFTKLNKLKYLSVNNTQVYFMPQNYYNDNLIYLDISSNRFNGMPEEINKLPNLERIGFNENIYYSSDDSILCKNQKLKEIYLGDCGIEKFPIGLKDLENLEQLILAGNRMMDVPYEIIKFKKLKYLYWGSFVTDKKRLDEIKKKMPDCIISNFSDKTMRPIIDIFK